MVTTGTTKTTKTTTRSGIKGTTVHDIIDVPALAVVYYITVVPAVPLVPKTTGIISNTLVVVNLSEANKMFNAGVMGKIGQMGYMSPANQ